MLLFIVQIKVSTHLIYALFMWTLFIFFCYLTRLSYFVFLAQFFFRFLSSEVGNR